MHSLDETSTGDPMMDEELSSFPDGHAICAMACGRNKVNFEDLNNASCESTPEDGVDLGTNTAASANMKQHSEIIKAALPAHIKEGDWHEDSNFFELGMDSLQATRLQNILQPYLKEKFLDKLVSNPLYVPISSAEGSYQIFQRRHN
ncbi:hypothetical protein PRK78_004191 [Emydomyces testavorans]|uniref:Carrier domain-containing protein n=1 Tax=Emydomyces testavorans TaxID=2070801 RepID=A0AAF0IJ24_9EURO|nr:hypothetical protein PRK78_004191 [Emydomyces testavorans]